MKASHKACRRKLFPLICRKQLSQHNFLSALEWNLVDNWIYCRPLQKLDFRAFFPLSIISNTYHLAEHK